MSKWIIKYENTMSYTAQCPKCRMRFSIAKDRIWKCCPLCLTKMEGVDKRQIRGRKGADDETD